MICSIKAIVQAPLPTVSFNGEATCQEVERASRGTRHFSHDRDYNIYIYTRSKKFSPKNKKDLGMACHISPLKKAKKHMEMPLPSLGPIPLKKCMGRDRGWVMAFPHVSLLF